MAGLSISAKPGALKKRLPLLPLVLLLSTFNHHTTLVGSLSSDPRFWGFGEYRLALTFHTYTRGTAGLHVAMMNDTNARVEGEASSGGNDATPNTKLDPPARSAAEVFDPFGLGDSSMNAMDSYLEDNKADTAADDGSSTRSPKPPPQLTRLAAVKKKDSSSRSKRISSPLPPRIVVKLGMHEEVSSMAKGGPDDDGASEVSVEGTVYVSRHTRDLQCRASKTLHDLYRFVFLYIVGSSAVVGCHEERSVSFNGNRLGGTCGAVSRQSAVCVVAV